LAADEVAEARTYAQQREAEVTLPIGVRRKLDVGLPVAHDDLRAGNDRAAFVEHITVQSAVRRVALRVNRQGCQKERGDHSQAAQVE
jgi:hypothetical protein